MTWSAVPPLALCGGLIWWPCVCPMKTRFINFPQQCRGTWQPSQSVAFLPLLCGLSALLNWKRAQPAAVWLASCWLVVCQPVNQLGCWCACVRVCLSAELYVLLLPHACTKYGLCASINILKDNKRKNCNNNKSNKESQLASHWTVQWFMFHAARLQ